MPAECARCAAALPAGALACSACHALVHAAELKTLAAEADGKADPVEQAAVLRAMRALLPPQSRQHAELGKRIAALDVPAPPAKSRDADAANARRGASGIASAGGAVLLALSKAKSVLPTVATMVLAFGAYWTAYGWQFAAGLVVSIWIHEMGHVIELRRRGIPASLPMFIPGVGAFVRLRQTIDDPRVDARIGLAGPVFGAVAAAACGLVYLATDHALWRGLATAGAMINLFNLTPVFTLDGSRAFHSMSQLQRAAIALAFAGGVFATSNGLLWLPLIAASVRIFQKSAPRTGDAPATLVFLALVAGLTPLAVA